MTKHKLFKFLTTRKGYLDWGSERIQDRFAEDLDVEEIDDVKNEVKDALQGTKKTAYEQFLEEEGLREEEVDTYKVWDTENGRNVSVKVKYDNKDSIDSLCEVFKDKLGDIATPEIKQPEIKKKENRKCDILGLHDAHIDKVVLASETGYDTDDTVKDNVETFVQKSLQLLYTSAKDNTDTVFVPVGSDFWTVNDDRNTTKRGTPQRVMVPFQESFEIGVEAVIKVIRYAAENFNSVIVPVIYGNHDEDLDFFLGMVLEQAFKNINHVQINKNRKERKYYRFGKNGFMFAHGYHSKSKRAMERLPLNFAEEATDIWSQTKGGIRKAFLGDIHNEEQYQFLRSKDSIGMNVQFMRSISNSGKYEWDQGWTGVPKSAYLWRYVEDGSKESVQKNVWW